MTIFLMIIAPITLMLFVATLETIFMAFAPDFEATMRRQRAERLSRPKTFGQMVVSLVGGSLIMILTALLLYYCGVAG